MFDSYEDLFERLRQTQTNQRFSGYARFNRADFTGEYNFTGGWHDRNHPDLKDTEICNAIAKAEDDACRAFGESWMRDKQSRIQACRARSDLKNRIVKYCKERYEYHIANP